MHSLCSRVMRSFSPSRLAIFISRARSILFSSPPLYSAGALCAMFASLNVCAFRQWMRCKCCLSIIIFAHVMVAITPTVIHVHTGTSIKVYISIDNTQSDRWSNVLPFEIILTEESLSHAKNFKYITMSKQNITNTLMRFQSHYAILIALCNFNRIIVHFLQAPSQLY